MRSPRPDLRVRVIYALRNLFRRGRSDANLTAGSTPLGDGSKNLDQSREVEEGGFDDHLDRLVEPDRPILCARLDVKPQNPSGKQLRTNMQPRAHLEFTRHRQDEATVTWPSSSSPRSRRQTENENNGRMARQGNRCVALVQLFAFVSSAPSETPLTRPERRQFVGGRIRPY